MGDFEKNKKEGHPYLLIHAAGISGIVLGAALIGYWVGKYCGDEPLGAMTGAFIGLAYVSYYLWRMAQSKR